MDTADEAAQAHDGDSGMDVRVPLIDRADFEPFEVERTAKGRYLLIPLSAGEFSMEEAREVARQASRAYGHRGVREISLWPKVGLRIALYDPPSRPSWW